MLFFPFPKTKVVAEELVVGSRENRGEEAEGEGGGIGEERGETLETAGREEAGGRRGGLLGQKLEDCVRESLGLFLGLREEKGEGGVEGRAETTRGEALGEG